MREHQELLRLGRELELVAQRTCFVAAEALANIDADRAVIFRALEVLDQLPIAELDGRFEIAATRITERGATRADDKISEAGMEDRKKEGYF